MADERREASKDNLLCLGQQIVAPIQCRLQRPMSGNRRPMAQFQQSDPRHQPGNSVFEAECGYLTRCQLDCQGYAVQLLANFRDKRRLLIFENEASRFGRYTSYKQLRRRILKHCMCRLLRAIWRRLEGKHPVTMLTFYLQQLPTRSQKTDALRFLIEFLGKQCDRLDHMLTAVENDKKLSRANKVDQLRAGFFRFECKSQGGCN